MALGSSPAAFVLSGRRSRAIEQTRLDPFLSYVLGQYVEADSEGLDQSHLPDYLRLKYGSFADGAQLMGGTNAVVPSFIDFQRYLYN